MPAQKRPATKATAPVKTVAKTVAKTAPKTPVTIPAKPVAAPAPAEAKAAKPNKPAKAEKPAKPAKPPKPPKLRTKPVRDGFTMPEADFALIATLKARALAAGRETKKSELLRAGLHALAALATPALVAALGQLEPVKVGRPKKGH